MGVVYCAQKPLATEPNEHSTAQQRANSTRLYVKEILEHIWRIELVDPTRFERVTFAFGGRRSIQLSYGSVAFSLAQSMQAAKGKYEPGRPYGCFVCKRLVPGAWQ